MTTEAQSKESTTGALPAFVLPRALLLTLVLIPMLDGAAIG